MSDMNAGRQEPYACTSVEFHEVGADGDAAAAAVVPVQAPAPAGAPVLVIVGGPCAHAAARAQALRIARRQTDGVLRLAVFDIETEAVAPDKAHLAELHTAFHAVLVVTPGRRHQVVRRLVRTILGFDGPEQWISCDWHDVSQIVRRSWKAPVRFGCGRAVGGERATLASLEAIGQADRQGPGLGAARGVCIGIRAANTIYGGEIKEVIHRIRARVPPGAAITMSLGADSSLDDGAFELDIFAFGQVDEAAALTEQGAESKDPVLETRDFHPGAGLGEDSLRDPLYAAARSIVIQNQRASISLVQRSLRIGYGRASALLDSMEGDVLSARGPDGTRTVLVPDPTPQGPPCP